MRRPSSDINPTARNYLDSTGVPVKDVEAALASWWVKSARKPGCVLWRDGDTGLSVVFEYDKDRNMITVQGIHCEREPTNGPTLSLPQATRFDESGGDDMEIYTPERIAEFLLSNAVDANDYAHAAEEVRKLGLDPDSIPHHKPAEVR